MENLAQYDPLRDKCPTGVVAKNTSVSFFLNADTSNIELAKLVIKNDEADQFDYYDMTKTEKGFEIKMTFENAGHFWYAFQIKTKNDYLYINKTFNNFSYISHEFKDAFFQSVIEKEYTSYNQMQGGIIYQIFVDRFCRFGEVEPRKPLIFRKDWGGKINKNTTDPLIINQEVFGGNFAGISSKLDYLQNLGVTILYLNPISMANSNHKYDTADYMRVDPMFGTEKDFEELIKEAKERNIKIIIDGVYNHTGSDSIYFNKYNRFDTLGAYKSQNSKFYNWYNWDEWPDKYGSWWGIDTLPSIRHECLEFQDYIAGNSGVIEKFMKQGIAGVRLDVVDEITDEFVEKIQKKVNEFGEDKIVVGEVWEDASTKTSYSKRRKYFVNHELSSVMNYPVKESIIEYIKTKEPTSLESTMRMLLNNYPKTVLDNLMNFLGTHDTGRIYSDIKAFCDGDEKLTLQMIKIATTILFTLPGVPSLFYGDEYGIENNDGSSRNCFDWNNYKTPVFEWFEKLTKIRKLEVLKDGEFRILMASHGKLVFDRFNDNQRIIVLVNLQKSKLEVNLDGKYKSFLTNRIINKPFKLAENKFEILIENK